MLGFDIPTFVFQIINFLILLAILSRFFYRPILEVMERRQAQIDARIEDAEQRVRQADEERQSLARQAGIAVREATVLVDTARSEAAKERQRLLEAAKAEAAVVLGEARRTLAAEEEAAMGRLSRRLSESAVKIAGALIRDSSGETVHDTLVDRLLSDGLGLDEAAQETAKLQKDWKLLVVESAYPLDASREKALFKQTALTLGRQTEDLTLEVNEVPELIAGVRLLVGALVVDMSLKHLLDELSKPEGRP